MNQQFDPGLLSGMDHASLYMLRERAPKEMQGLLRTH
jgi:hypothetical protein